LLNNNPDNQNPKSPSAPAYSKEQEQFMALCYGAFKMNKEGKEWLDFMVDTFLQKLPVSDPSKDSSYAFYREGQNSLIRSILQNMRGYEDVIKANNKSGD